MKIKHDFVTNKRSSNFILGYKTTKVACKKMVDIIFREWKNDGTPVEKNIKKKILETIKSLKGDENILIPFSSKYETFISKRNDGSIQAETCNNHNWDDLDIIRYLTWDEDFEKHKEMTFLNIETGKNETQREYFKKVYGEYSFEVAEFDLSKKGI